MPISKTSTSRFYHTEPIIRNGKETYGLWTRPDVVDPDKLEENDVIQFEVTQMYAGRPDLIAAELYGTATLEWIVVMFNRPRNPLGWPRTGATISLPRASVVRGLL